MGMNSKLSVSIFYCINSFNEKAGLPFAGREDVELKYVKMACSSMVKDIFLLRAFESGSDAVIVFVCPEESCRYVEGSIRAGKRVNKVKEILDEIGLDSNRLSLCNTIPGNADANEQIIAKVIADLEQKGPLFTDA